ncbi:MAG: DUF305 domain-containing protein [Pseudomonadales bacterium]
MAYTRFAAMIATSTVAMLILMYLNTFTWEHVFFSETRVYMAIVMGSCMAVIMLAYMLAMYQNTMVNAGIFIGSIIVFALALWLVRSQATVGQVSYMRAMVPHHSIAIMTSERAQITDPRVRRLADEIIEAQQREIAEIRYLIADLRASGDAARPAIYEEEDTGEVVSVSEALRATRLGALHPEPLEPAEADQVLGPGRGCSFLWTAESDPILTARIPASETPVAHGVMKLNGKLVALHGQSQGGFEALAAGAAMAADGLRVSVAPVADAEAQEDNGTTRRRADLMFELEQGRTVGYRGFYRCSG